jgi:hypothetical protein
LPQPREALRRAYLAERHKPLPADLLDREQAAGYANVSVPTMDRARYRKELQYTNSHRNGRGRVLMRRRWIDEWLDTFMRVVIVIVLLGAACHVACEQSDGYRDVTATFSL